jgi:hypothetical protein
MKLSLPKGLPKGRGPLGWAFPPLHQQQSYELPSLGVPSLRCKHNIVDEHHPLISNQANLEVFVFFFRPCPSKSWELSCVFGGFNPPLSKPSQCSVHLGLLHLPCKNLNYQNQNLHLIVTMSCFQGCKSLLFT